MGPDPKDIRCFLAIRIPESPPLRALLSDLQDLGRAVGVTAVQNLHITVKFLGDVGASDISSISQAVNTCCQFHTPFDIELFGCGVFPHRGPPRVVWVGIEPTEPLTSLAVDVDDRLVQLGFPSENRPFRPHLTVARLRGHTPRGLQSLLRAQCESSFGKVAVRSIELMESTLGRHGVTYTVVESRTLAG